MAGVLRGRVSACEGPRGASTEPRPRARWRGSALPCAVVSSGLRWHFLISQTPFWTSSLSQSVHRENAFAETPSRDTEELSAGRRAEGLTAEAPSLDGGALSSLRRSVDCCLPFTAHVLRLMSMSHVKGDPSRNNQSKKFPNFNFIPPSPTFKASFLFNSSPIVLL